MSVVTITSQEQLGKLNTGYAVLNFWADWSVHCKQTNDVFQKLAEKFPALQFAQIEAEKVPDVTEKYSVLSVPHFVFLHAGLVKDQLEGANVSELSGKVYHILKLTAAPTVHATATPATAPTTATTTAPAAPALAEPSGKAGLNARIEKLLKFAPVMLFMKGTPDKPQCGFSSKIVGLLKQEDIQFSSFNILADEEVRQGLKEFSNWPTYPQLYIGGKLVGGLDIVKELVEGGELKGMVPEQPKVETLNERLAKLINSHPIMVFIKGQPEAPVCGFSKKLVSILEAEGLKFGSFDILSDEEVRQGLKTYSNWPTYPQVYAKGKLVGGLDIVKELQDQGELKDALAM